VRQGDEFDLAFAEFATRSWSGHYEPNSDVFFDDAGERIVVHVELAGIDSESLRVGVDERHLVIVGSRTQSPGARHGTLLQKEIQYGEFVKKIRLPVPISYEDASALYRDGILTIELPVSATSHFPTHRTEIRMIVRRTPA
jgi:HSP20 family protein